MSETSYCRISIVLALLISIPPVNADELAPRIVNGLMTHDFPTTGHLLTGSDPDSAGSWCSGTMIGCSTFLTAAHCVCDGVGSQCQPGAGLEPNPTDWQVFLQHSGVHGVASVSVHPAFNFPFADVAVVRLSQPIDGITPTPINTVQRPPLGTEATIAGFGRSGGGNFDYGLLRFGDVVTGPCTVGGVDPSTSVCWSFTSPIGAPGEDSNTCNADSGGPLFLDFGTGEVVAGITSGGTNGSCMPTDNSYDSDVFAWSAYIQAQAGTSLGEASCGGLSQIGDASTVMAAFDGAVSQSVSEGRDSFEVPSDKTQLRVTMNAVDDGPSNFNLYVKEGSAPTLTDYDCARVGPGQFAGCVFDNPGAGTWHTLVHRVSGGGSYQVTATAFEGEPSTGLNVALSTETPTITLGDPFTFAMELRSPPGGSSMFDLVVAIVPPNQAAIPIVQNPGLELPPDTSTTIQPTLPLPATLPTGNWNVVAALFQNGSEVSFAVLNFEIQ